MREWLAERIIHNLAAHSFTITNRRFESTVAVQRTDIEDDRLGIFKPAFSKMGNNARRHPDELVFGLLKSGFSTNCYDGQNYFDTDHPVIGSDGAVKSVANTDGGSGAPWFLLDVSRGVRPIIWQERAKYEFQSITDSNDHHLFMNDEYIYCVRARVNAGFGLWHLGWGSKQDLTTESYAGARAAMMNFRADGDRIPGIQPTILVVPPVLEQKALHILNALLNPDGGSNVWKGTAELIVTPWIA